MAFNDALFQLGMDLTRSSPAQKEDLHALQDARVALEDATSRRGSVAQAGRHLMIDLYGARRLDDLEHVQRTLERCVEASGATLLHVHLHDLKPDGGVTGVAVLKESHIAIHGWPQSGYAALDIFMSGSADPARAVSVLIEAFETDDVRVTASLRGTPPAGNGGQKSKRMRKPAEAARPRAVRKAKAAA